MSSMIQGTDSDIREQDTQIGNEVTCDCCARLFVAVKKRHYCSHCNKYFHVCPTCIEERIPKCRFCGIPLKKKNEAG